MTWGRRRRLRLPSTKQKRGARRCCGECGARLLDVRPVGGLRPVWKCPLHGIRPRGVRSYASGLEADTAMTLKQQQQRGQISDLREQVLVDVEPPHCERITWRVDFQFMEAGRLVRLESKGMNDETFSIKRKLHAARYPTIELRIVRRGWRNRLVSGTR